MPIIQLTANTARGKYGRIRVKNTDGSFNREFNITGTQLSALKAAGKWTSTTHAGVTRVEWESGRAICMGKDFDVGDMKLMIDGSLRIKFAETVVAGQLTETQWLHFKTGEFTGTPPNISVSQAVLDSSRVVAIASNRVPDIANIDKGPFISTKIASITSGRADIK